MPMLQLNTSVIDQDESEQMYYMLQIFLELQSICKLLLEVWQSLPLSPYCPAVMKWGRTFRHQPVPQLPPAALALQAYSSCVPREKNTIKQTLVTLGTVASAYKVTKLLYTYMRAASEICRVLGSTTMKQSAVFFLQYSYTKFLPTVLANISGTMLHTCNMPQMMDT